MIPKIIHQMFFGDWPLNDLNKRCRDSWRAILPDYHFFDWTPESLPDGYKTPWVRKGLTGGRGPGANASAWVKSALLYDMGGLYFDNDMELLRAPEMNHAFFCGWQRDGVHADVNMSACGCIPGHPFAAAMMQEIAKRPFNDSPLAMGPAMWTRMLRERGLTGNNIEQTVGDVKVYSREKWYPYFWDEHPGYARITPETFGVHHWEGSWKK